MDNTIPYLDTLAAVLEVPIGPFLLNACVDKLCCNPAGYTVLFETMDPTLLAALKRTCEEMLVGTRESLEASVDGLGAENWEEVEVGNELARVLEDDESIDGHRSRVKDLERLSEFLNRF